MLACILDGGNIHIIPYSLVCLHLYTVVPVKRLQILAQAWVGDSVVYVQTELQCLVAVHLQIYILCIPLVVGSLKALQLLYQTAQHVWSQSAQLKASWQWESHFCTCSVLAIRHKTDSYVCFLIALVCQIYAGSSTLALEQIHRNLVPLGSTSLVGVWLSVYRIDSIQTWGWVTCDSREG